MKLSEMGGDLSRPPPQQPQEMPKTPAQAVPSSMKLSDMSKPADTAPSRGEMRAPPGGDLAPDDEEAAFEKRKELEKQGKGRGDAEWESLTRQLAKSQAKGREEAIGYAPIGAPIGPANIVSRAATGLGKAVTTARGAGFVVPPKMTGQASVTEKALEALGGKVKLAQEASEINQPVVNNLAKKAIGLPETTVLSDEVLKSVRKEAGLAYEGVAMAVPKIVADEAFKKAVQELSLAGREAAEYFPGLMKNPQVEQMVKALSVEEFSPRAGLDIVSKLRFDSKTNLKSFMDPEKQALGLAQRDAANAIDSLMERNIDKAGNKGPLVEAYKAARQRIARSYDIESVLNDSTGDVSAAALARLSTKKPLTDELKTIATAATAFQKAFQDVAKFGGVETWSVGDVAAATYGAKHVKALAVEAGMRPAARKYVLSEGVQNRLSGRATPPPKFEPTTPRVPFGAAVPLSTFAEKMSEDGQ